MISWTTHWEGLDNPQGSLVHTLRTKDLDSETENMLNLKAVDKYYKGDCEFIRLKSLLSVYKSQHIEHHCQNVPGPAFSFPFVKLLLENLFSIKSLSTQANCFPLNLLPMLELNIVWPLPRLSLWFYKPHFAEFLLRIISFLLFKTQRYH